MQKHYLTIVITHAHITNLCQTAPKWSRLAFII